MPTPLHISGVHLLVNNYNDDFLILRADPAEGLTKLGIALFQANLKEIDEVIVTPNEICIKLSDHFRSSNITAKELLQSEKWSSLELPQPRRFTLPVFFGLEGDWQHVIQHTHKDQPTVIAHLEQQVFTIDMFGFLPGFVYLSGLAPEYYIPRKTVPSKYVAANSVAIGGRYLGVYALDSPGGWNVIGKTPVTLLELPNLPPVRNHPGDEIRIQAIDEKTYHHLKAQNLTLTEYNDPP